MLDLYRVYEHVIWLRTQILLYLYLGIPIQVYKVRCVVWFGNLISGFDGFQSHLTEGFFFLSVAMLE